MAHFNSGDGNGSSERTTPVVPWQEVGGGPHTNTPRNRHEAA